jgi:hypothetical protein
MPQPVQPPETPAIIRPVTSEDEVRLDKASNDTSVAVPNQTGQTGVLATPTPPETFAPESSSLRIEKSAALLGPPISVGYSVQPAPVATEELQVSALKVESFNLQPSNPPTFQPSNPSNLQPSNLPTLQHFIHLS